MNESQINELKSLIEECDFVDFAPFGKGVSDVWIAKAENALGITLPASYIWWLTNYGGGEVGHDQEIYSIYEMDFETVNGGDIVFQAMRNKARNVNPKERLYILERGHHSVYFDTSTKLENGEYSIIEDWDGEEIKHSDFLSFLSSFIRRCQ